MNEILTLEFFFARENNTGDFVFGDTNVYFIIFYSSIFGRNFSEFFLNFIIYIIIYSENNKFLDIFDRVIPL